MQRIGSYHLRIIGPDVDTYDGGPNNMMYIMHESFDKKNQEVIDGIGSVLSQAQELVSNSLPEGFYCKIEE